MSENVQRLAHHLLSGSGDRARGACRPSDPLLAQQCAPANPAAIGVQQPWTQSTRADDVLASSSHAGDRRGGRIDTHLRFRSKAIVLALLMALLVAASSSAAIAQTSPNAGHSQVRADQKVTRTTPALASSGPTVLVLPGGGWQNADSQTMTPWVRDFQNHGIRARAITYPLRDVLGAIRHVRDVAAKEPGPVVLYGISAGGTIAAALAATGEVDGAINVVGPTDFTRWITPAGLKIMNQIHMSKFDRRAASPYWRLNGNQSPQLIQCGLADPLVSYDQCVRYAAAASRAQPDTRLQAMVNAHGQFSADMRAARAWINARWPTARPAPG